MVQTAAAGQEVAAAGLREARSGRLPQLEFSETFTNSNNPVFVFGSLLEQGRFGAPNFAIDSLNSPGSMSNFRSALNLRIPLFNRFQVASEIERAGISQDQAEADMDWVKQQIRFEVIRAYFGVVVAETRKKVAAEAVVTAESEVESIRNRLEQGMVVESDLLAMKVQLAEFRQQWVQSNGEEQTARAGLNSVLAQPIATAEVIRDQLEDRVFTVPSQSELVAEALQNRPDYLKTRKEIELRRQDFRAAKGQFWPDLNLFGQLGHSTHNFSSGSGDFAVGANLTFKLLDLRRGAQTDKASAASEAARAQERQHAHKIQFEVVQAYQTFLSSQERLQLAASAVDQAAEALRIVQDRHGVGLTTITEVLRAQTALLRTRLNLLSARYDYYLGYAQILLATGSLTNVNPLTA
jgi:outer membrane protein TolC